VKNFSHGSLHRGLHFNQAPVEHERGVLPIGPRISIDTYSAYTQQHLVLRLRTRGAVPQVSSPLHGVVLN
jgi:hypothetical protein